MLKIEDPELLRTLLACVRFAYRHVGGADSEEFWKAYADAGKIQPAGTMDTVRESTNMIEVETALESALSEAQSAPRARGIADVTAFLDKVREHTSGTKNEKYAAGRNIEPVDAIVNWYGKKWLAGTAVKYLSRIHLGNEKDIFKAVHYLGMLWNARHLPD